jgi:toxin ParE1/3/4
VIRWTPEAVSNLEGILLYIAEDKPEAAQETATEIYRRIEALLTFPNRGRAGREPGTRELVMSPLPYIAVYRVEQAAIQILRIWHGAQRRAKRWERE